MLEEIDLDRQLRLGLDTLPFTDATEVQQRVIPAALAGNDLLVCAETGSGKTLAYLLPLAQKILSSDARKQPGTLALVLVPTRELARQVVKQCDQLFSRSPLQALAITGGAQLKYQKARLRKDPDIVVATPGRLLEHLQHKSVDLSALQTLVLDEADRMLDLGLRDDVLAIADACTSQPQALLLSATLSHRGVSVLSETLLNSPRSITVGKQRKPHGNIRHQLILADSQMHKNKLLTALLLAGDLRRTLVFCNTRKTATGLARLLAKEQLACDCLHGELSTEERKLAIERFTEGKTRILCASDVAARGLDVADIDAVVNFDVPANGDDYIHRSGRTGRAGATGLAITLAGPGDERGVAGIERQLSSAFERRTLPGLKARYNGPGDAEPADTPKKTMVREANPRKRKAGERTSGKQNTRDTARPLNDGFAPLKRKKPGKKEPDE